MATRTGRSKGNRAAPTRQGKQKGKLANRRAREATADLIDHRFRKALSHELRVQILSVASQREISPSQFSEEFDVPLSNVSYHFRQLVKYDCLELVREVPRRGSFEHRYVGTGLLLFDLSTLLAFREDRETTRRSLISDEEWRQLGKGTQAGVRIAGFQDLINRCTQAVEAETFDSRDDAAFYWVPMVLDEIGWTKMQKDIREIIAKSEDWELESVKRATRGESETFPATFGILGFESPKKPNWKRGKRKAAKKVRPTAASASIASVSRNG